MPIDSRYTIAMEYCGYAEPRYVVRFCGQWVGQSANRSDARQIAESHNRARF
jgi:hypothetical protein